MKGGRGALTNYIIVYAVQGAGVGGVVVARRSGDALSRKDDKGKRTRASWTRSGY